MAPQSKLKVGICISHPHYKKTSQLSGLTLQLLTVCGPAALNKPEVQPDLQKNSTHTYSSRLHPLVCVSALYGVPTKTKLPNDALLSMCPHCKWKMDSVADSLWNVAWNKFSKSSLLRFFNMPKHTVFLRYGILQTWIKKIKTYSVYGTVSLGKSRG